MLEEKIKLLVAKHLNQSLTKEESEELASLIQVYPGIRQLMERLDDEELLGLDLRQWARTDVAQNLQHTWKYIDEQEAPAIRRQHLRVIGLSCAAAIILAIVIIGLHALPAINTDTPVASNTLPDDANAVSANSMTTVPHNTHATLTLVDKRSIKVDSFGTGKITDQNNSQVIKQENGAVAYVPTPAHQKGVERTTSAPQYNTLTVPAGGQACLILPDQTKVWLNNMSSLRYPVAFSGATRTVWLTGEAYFEVAQDPLKPFHVQANGLDVAVLGTRFTVTSYTNEPEKKATLLDGKVQVASAVGKDMLQPGEQLIITGNNKQILKDISPDEALAWKDGYFHFSHANINAVLRQLCRWYGMEIDNRAPDIRHIYDGEISRNLSADEVLKNLENDDVHFRIENKKIIVTR